MVDNFPRTLRNHTVVLLWVFGEWPLWFFRCSCLLVIIVRPSKISSLSLKLLTHLHLNLPSPPLYNVDKTVFSCKTNHSPVLGFFSFIYISLEPWSSVNFLSQWWFQCLHFFLYYLRFLTSLKLVIIQVLSSTHSTDFPRMASCSACTYLLILPVQ